MKFNIKQLKKNIDTILKLWQDDITQQLKYENIYLDEILKLNIKEFKKIYSGYIEILKYKIKRYERYLAEILKYIIETESISDVLLKYKISRAIRSEFKDVKFNVWEEWSKDDPELKWLPEELIPYSKTYDPNILNSKYNIETTTLPLNIVNKIFTAMEMSASKR